MDINGLKNATCVFDPRLSVKAMFLVEPIFEPPRGKTNNVVSEQSDTNRPVQAQKRARSLKFRI